MANKGVSAVSESSNMQKKLLMRGVGRGKKPTAEAEEFNRRAFARHEARRRLYAKYPNYPHPGMKSTALRRKLSLNMSPASDGEDHQAEKQQETSNDTPSDISPYNPSFENDMFDLPVDNWADLPTPTSSSQGGNF